MANRDSLHHLVDTLPPEAYESIERILQHHQKWMLRKHIDGEKMHDQLRKRFEDYAKEHAPPPGRGTIIGFAGGGGESADGDASFAMLGWEGETLVQVEHRVFRTHKLEIEERFRISSDKSLLVYSEIVRGPGGKEDTHEVTFNIGS